MAYYRTAWFLLYGMFSALVASVVVSLTLVYIQIRATDLRFQDSRQQAPNQFLFNEGSLIVVGDISGTLLLGSEPVNTKDNHELITQNPRSTVVPVDRKIDVPNTAHSVAPNAVFATEESTVRDTELKDKAAKPEEVACKFPLLDPWDMSILPYYIKSKRSFNCHNIQPYFSSILDGQYLVLNSIAFSTYLSSIPSNNTVHCFYATVTRAPFNDENLTISTYTEFRVGDRITVASDVVNVQCRQMPTGNVIYSNTHALFSNASLNASRTSQQRPETEDNLSVLHLLIDSTSLSMFRRELPDSYTFIKDMMKFHIFKGYNKVGDNSFMNMIPVLTGKRPYNHGWDMPDEFGENFLAIKFDHWPIIWKEFAANGYITAYNEDQPQWGLFNYYMKGFVNKPVDHYFRPFWLTLLLSELQKSWPFCFGNEPKAVLQLNIIADMYKKYPDMLKYMMAFLSEISHNNDGVLGQLDSNFHRILRNLYESGALNKTVVILMADHGQRFSTLRQTLVGLIEERMPMFAIWFPDWFLKKHPKIAQNLRKNERRLSANFDVHETLKDILSSNFDGQQRPLQERGLSQLYELPANRSCKTAGIPKFYCTCGEKTSTLAVTDSLVKSVAEFLIAEINTIMISSVGNLCATFQLQKVIRAELLEPNQQLINAQVYYEKANYTSYKESEIKMYRVAVEALPGKAQFETVVNYNTITKSMYLNGGVTEISRINEYGNQSYCCPEFVLRKICYCAIQ